MTLGLCQETEGRGVDDVLVSVTNAQAGFFAIGLGAPEPCAVFAGAPY